MTTSALEPSQNISQYISDQKLNEEMDEIGEEWTQEVFVNLPIELNAKLVDYFFLNAKMLCIFEDFQVQEVDINTKETTKSFNL